MRLFCLGILTAVFGAVAQAEDCRFDKTISEPVLRNYLARSITVCDLLTGQGNFDDNLRMLQDWTTGAFRTSPVRSVSAAAGFGVMTKSVGLPTNRGNTATLGCGTPGTGCTRTTPTGISKCPACAHSPVPWMASVGITRIVRARRFPTDLRRKTRSAKSGRDGSEGTRTFSLRNWCRRGGLLGPRDGLGGRISSSRQHLPTARARSGRHERRA